MSATNDAGAAAPEPGRAKNQTQAVGFVKIVIAEPRFPRRRKTSH